LCRQEGEYAIPYAVKKRPFLEIYSPLMMVY